MRFDFETLSGDSLQAFLEATGLGQLDSWARDVDGGLRLVEAERNESDAGMPFVQAPTTNRSLSVLRIHEENTTGMYGPWAEFVDDEEAEFQEGKMNAALLSWGDTVKPPGAGGSYGYGKAGLFRASRSRAIYAYTCFRPSTDVDNGVSRRACGAAVWKKHSRDKARYTAYAMFGLPVDSDDAMLPLNDASADAFAMLAGLPTRNPNDPNETGTSFLVVDCSFSAADLISALALFWWPALIAGRLEVSVVNEGAELPLDPREYPELDPFIRSYEALANAADLNDRLMIRKMNPIDVDGEHVSPGTTALAVSEQDGWSWSTDEDGCHSIALVRSLDMVVAYHDAGRALPRVRGVFRSDDGDANLLLRKTEPTDHSRWDTQESRDVPHAATRFAAETLKRISRTASDFAKSQRPEPVTDGRPFPEWDRLFGGGGTGAPDPGTRDPDPWRIEILEEQVVQAREGGAWSQVSCLVAVSLKEGAPFESIPAKIRVAFAADESADQTGSPSTEFLRIADAAVNNAPLNLANTETLELKVTLTTEATRIRVTSSAFPSIWNVGPWVIVDGQGAEQ
jgi:hypothetical protein